MESIAYISIGANLGDRIGNIEKAIHQIDKIIGNVIKRSSIFSTEPVGFTANEDFLNLCISVSTKKSPLDLLNNLKQIELDLGRQKKSKNGVYESRLIDLDIILYKDVIFQSEELIIPHPRYHERMFVLKPLSEIAPNFCDPAIDKTIKQLYINCIDRSEINFYKH